ncbi:YafY family transcriptional regulator [Bacteroidales bacterium]|nr:YafY family transcriptional regulator [Bacteroidales bacterium]
MNRIDRLQAILTHLQSKKTVTGHEIADRFNISLRTVYRDIKALEEGGVPIGSEAGVGYFINDTYHLPPVMFTTAEASSLIIASKLVEKMSDNNIQKNFEAALYKIKSVLRSSDKDHIEEFQEKVSVVGYHPQHNESGNKCLSQIEKALVKKQLLNIAYEAQYSGEQTLRTIEPIGLCHYGYAWHVIAYCHLRHQYRDFKLTRIKSISSKQQSFSIGSHITMHDFFEQQRTLQNFVEISLLVNKKSARFIAESKYWYGFTKQEEFDKKYYRMFFLNADLDGFSRWVIMGADQVIAESPEKLKTMVKNHALTLYQHLK